MATHSVRKRRCAGDSGALVRVAVLDDHNMSRLSVVRTLERHGRFSVCLAASLRPSVPLGAAAPHAVAVHLSACSTDGLDCIAHVRKTLPRVRLVSYSFCPLPPDFAERLSAAGASAHIGHDASPEHLAEALLAASAGPSSGPSSRSSSGPAFGSAAGSAAGSTAVGSPFAPRVLGPRIRDELSARERAVWGYLGLGMSFREIGQELGIDFRTVSTYCQRIRAKLRIPECVKLPCLAARVPAAPAVPAAKRRPGRKADKGGRKNAGG